MDDNTVAAYINASPLCTYNSDMSSELPPSRSVTSFTIASKIESAQSMLRKYTSGCGENIGVTTAKYSPVKLKKYILVYIRVGEFELWGKWYTFLFTETISIWVTRLWYVLVAVVVSWIFHENFPRPSERPHSMLLIRLASSEKEITKKTSVDLYIGRYL